MPTYPEAVWRPGPPGKVYTNTNSIEGIILHSMVGSLAGSYSVLDDVGVTAANSYRSASWHFSIAKDGTVYQHYLLEACPFHAGSGQQNRRLIGVEHEGGAPNNLSEPLTEPQLAASVRLAQWIGQQGGFDLSRGDGPNGPMPRTLLQHREVSATECPSGRFDNIWHHYVAPPAGRPSPLDPDVLGPNVQLVRYRGFNRSTSRFEYELAVLQTWGGDTVGPNIDVAYEGYDPAKHAHTLRLGVLKHWTQ